MPALRLVHGIATLSFLAAAGCSEPPREVLDAVRDALAAGDREALAARIDPEYADALGDRAALLHDVDELFETYGRVVYRITDAEVVLPPETPLRMQLIGRLDVDLAGEPTWRVAGPLGVELSRRHHPLITGGLLDDLRGIRALLMARRAALEANDTAGYGALLHPGYQDGSLDRDAVLARVTKDLHQLPIRQTPIHELVEVRGPLAHVDERYTVRIGERLLGPALSRLTLKRSAGRWLITAGLYPAAKPDE